MRNINELMLRYPLLKNCEQSILNTVNYIINSFKNGGRLYICGNGGSASDALHIVGELVKSFTVERKIDKDFETYVGKEFASNIQGALPAYALVENTALSTAYANDVNADYVFAQQVYAYARKGDCVLCISTSGNSKNVLYALKAARGRGAITLGLSGKDGGEMKDMCDECIIVPENETYKIQELHLPVYHCICIMIEEYFWGDKHE